MKDVEPATGGIGTAPQRFDDPKAFVAVAAASLMSAWI